MFKTLKGLLAGLIAGTAVGMLFSPKKGSEIRKDFKKEFKGGGIGLSTAKNTLGDMGKDIGSTVKEGYDKIPEDKKREAAKLAQKAEGKAKNLFNTLKSKIAGKKK
ncbi:YtxH domain-containing protein [Candidatus Peregrinibacteria bacterium]|nr:YtxH domain-containing protein [Candidatus Peregrinibacteria bacterium]